MTRGPFPGKPRSRWWVGYLGCLGLLFLCCLCVGAASLLLRSPSPERGREILSGKISRDVSR
ncbi:hypothetical protein ACFLXB_09675 [Chloroflexota bacterium]